MLLLGPLGTYPAQGRIAATAVGVLLAACLPSANAYLLWNLGLVGLLALVAQLARRVASPRDARQATVGALIGGLACLAWKAGPSPLAVVLAFCLYRAVDVFRPRPLPAIARRWGPLARDGACALLTALALLALRFSLYTPQAWTGGTP